MLESLKGCKFQYSELSNFESFNDDCAIVKEAQDANLLSQESKLMCVILGQVWYLIVSIPDLCTLTYFAAELVSFKFDDTSLKTDTFSIP